MEEKPESPIPQDTSQLPSTINSPRKKFSVLNIVLIILFLGSTTAAGVYYYTKPKNTLSLATTIPEPSPLATSNPTLSPSPSSQPTPTATPNPYVSWKTYTDSDLGFSFKYPPTVEVSSKVQGMDKTMSLQTGLYLEVQKQAVNSIPVDAPHNFDQATALKDQAELNSGQWGEEVFGWTTVSNSHLVSQKGTTYAKTGVILDMHDTCTPMFEQDTEFYKNNTQVTIRLAGGINQITQDMPSFFIDGATSGLGCPAGKNIF